MLSFDGKRDVFALLSFPFHRISFFFLLFSVPVKKMMRMISRNDVHHCTLLLHRFEQASCMSCRCRLHENLNRLQKLMFIVILFTSSE